MTAQDDIARRIATSVRAARKAAGMSRKQLASAAEVSERYLNELEKGEANVSVGVLTRVGEALSIALPDLVGSPGPKPDDGPLAQLGAEMTPAEQSAAAIHLRQWLDEHRRTRRGIALLGLRGAGKSTIGRLLSQRYGLPFVSVTREIELRAGMRLDDLFNLGRAETYRMFENEVVADLARRDDRIVLETAGGIVSNNEALEIVLRSFRTVWLKAAPEEHLARVAQQGDMRPMQGTPRAFEHLKGLLAQRESDYARAEHVLDTTGRTAESCVQELDRLLVTPVTAPGRADAATQRASALRAADSSLVRSRAASTG